MYDNEEHFDKNIHYFRNKSFDGAKTVCEFVCVQYQVTGKMA